MPSLDLVVTDWADLDRVLHTDLNPATAGRFHPHLAYRGVSSASWPTLTSLQRIGGDYATLEAHLLQDFHKYSLPTVAPDSSDWEVLTIGQHFGLPTRLLDWTYSPLVALHFATWDMSVWTDEAVIWMVDYRGLHRALPAPLRAAFDGELGDSFSIATLVEHTPSVADLETLAGDSAMLLFEPTSLDARVVNQYAALGVASNATANVADLLEDLGRSIARRVVIPASLKPEIRDRLDQDNITERMLFPGLDGLSKWLRRYYSPTAGESRRAVRGLTAAP